MTANVIQGYFAHGAPRAAATPLPRHIPPFPAHGGSPLAPAVLQQVESLFGASFGDVRVHVGPLPSSIGALAFTQGSHIHFAPGQYDPATVRGRRILGHELAHVVQQRSGRVRNPLASGTAIVHDARLEAEAEQMARRASTVQPHAPAPQRPQTVQGYFVLGPTRIYGRMPAKRPWFGYPYAVVSNAAFPAQQIATAIDGSDSFLSARGPRAGANVVNAGRGLSLRLSDDYNMAIEHSTLERRQPKVFFATNTVINASNLSLQNVGSRVRLQRNGDSITLLTGWSSQKMLFGVAPVLATGGSADTLPQNCNAIAAEIVGAEAGSLALSRRPFQVASRIASEAWERFDRARRDHSVSNAEVERLEQEVIRAYARAWDYGPVHRELANEWAAPEVGEAYMIATLGRGTDLGGGRGRVFDYASRRDRDVPWRFHFAGVVARSGHDRITLENFARGDNRQLMADPRWYFQMYSETMGQTFHETHAATRLYANPITIRYRP